MTKGFEKMSFAYAASTDNRETLELSRNAVCYNCLSEIAVSEITKWVDGGDCFGPPRETTAVCPKCGIDSVIPKELFTDMGCTLKELHDYWFEGYDPNSGYSEGYQKYWLREHKDFANRLRRR